MKTHFRFVAILISMALVVTNSYAAVKRSTAGGKGFD